MDIFFFDTKNAMVVPSLIRKAHENDIIEVWGDGSAIRDFIHAKDVARGMMFVYILNYLKQLLDIFYLVILLLKWSLSSPPRR